VRNRYSQNNQEVHLGIALGRAFINTANHHCRSHVWTPNSAFKYSGGDLAIVRATILRMQDDDDTNRQISNDVSDDIGESGLPSNIEDDDFDNRQEVLGLDDERCDKTIRTTGVPLTMKRSRADTVIVRTPLPARGRSHHHCSNANSQPSTYQASLTLYRGSRYPRPVETRMFIKQRPVKINTFCNTKRLHLR